MLQTLVAPKRVLICTSCVFFLFASPPRAQSSFNAKNEEHESALERALQDAAEARASIEDSLLRATEAEEALKLAQKERAKAELAREESENRTTSLIESSAKLETRLQEEQATIARLEEAVETATAKATDSARRLEELEKRTSFPDAEGRVQELEVECAMLREQAEAREARVAEVTTEIAHLREELDRVSAERSGAAHDAQSSVARRLDEAEEAAAAAARKLATSEEELVRVRASLDKSEAENKALAWQLKMMADPPLTTSPTASSSRRPNVAGLLDVFGCTANYDRRKDKA